MTYQVALLLVLFSLGFSAAQAPDTDLPEYYHLPHYIINLDQDPAMRFAQVTEDFKDQTNKMIDDYLHLVPQFVRHFFEDNIDVIKLRHLEHYREVEGISAILERETWLVYLLNYAYELSKALCTSIVARQADGTVIHGRNMDFAFPDAMRNASYIASFYRKGEYLYDAVMFTGYVGVLSAYKENSFSFTLNARGVDKGILNYFHVMGQIYIGLPEAGMEVREIFEEVQDFESAVEAISSSKTIIPFYATMSGPGKNEGIVISKDPDGVAFSKRLDDETWYIVQTNDDHFAGVCQQRCQDGNEHMQGIGADAINIENLLEEVLLVSHNFNKFTIYTTMFDTGRDYFKAYGFDTDMPYVHQEAPKDMPF